MIWPISMLAVGFMVHSQNETKWHTDEASTCLYGCCFWLRGCLSLINVDHKHGDGVTYKRKITGAHSVHFTVTIHRGCACNSRTFQSVSKKNQKNLCIKHNLNKSDFYLIKMMCYYTNPAHFLTDDPKIIWYKGY